MEHGPVMRRSWAALGDALAGLLKDAVDKLVGRLERGVLGPAVLLFCVGRKLRKCTIDESKVAACDGVVEADRSLGGTITGLDRAASREIGLGIVGGGADIFGADIDVCCGKAIGVAVDHAGARGSHGGRRSGRRPVS